MSVSEQATHALEKTTMRRVILRIVPFLIICYFFALLDRVNIGFAALQMNKDLGLTPQMFGFAASLFFVSYFLVEVPSNLALQRVGARRWLARIMVTWGFVTMGMAFVVGPHSLYVMRFVLGAGEAGFFPGAILYLTYWLPSEYRARILATFTVSIPLATFLGSPLSVSILELHGALGLRGWQWLFILEGIPTVLLGITCLFYLTDKPRDASWLTGEQREWLVGRLDEEAARKKPTGHLSLWELARNKYFLTMALVCSGASATGSVLSVWQPQIIKSFGLTNLQTGFVNSIPYGIATILMILWGRHSDQSGERRWHTATPLLLAAFGLGVRSRSVGESAKLVLHFGRSYGPDTPWQRHDHACHPSCATAIEGSAQRVSRKVLPQPEDGCQVAQAEFRRQCADGSEDASLHCFDPGGRGHGGGLPAAYAAAAGRLPLCFAGFDTASDALIPAPLFPAPRDQPAT